MANTIKLHKGLNVPLEGKAADRIEVLPVKGTYGLRPDDFTGMKAKVVVKEGENILAGDALFVCKDNPDLKVVSPVSGCVKAVVRGERRKLLSIQVEADAEQKFRAFDVQNASQMNGEQVKALLMESGLFAYFKQRPYDVVANPANTPKGIFISTFNKMPLAACFNVVLKGKEADFQAGIDALSKIAPVYLGICTCQAEGALASVKNATITAFDGPNPSGNVGVQINHVSPINKGEIAWTLGAEIVLFIGQLMNTGKVNFTRTIAGAGSRFNAPCYYTTPIGTSLSVFSNKLNKENGNVRLINGNPLVGSVAQENDFLAAFATEVCAIPEGNDKDEVLGWIMPRTKDFSTNRSYFSWLFGKKEYDLDARIKGGERHIIMSGEYDKVLPMDIYAGYLIKAIITGDLDKMEQLGILEVAPEDFAVAEFIDSSKLELQRIVREGLNMYKAEMGD